MNSNTLQKKEIKVFLKDDAKDSYFQLKTKSDKPAKTLLSAIDRTINLLATNPQLGDPISKKQFPKQLIQRYNINNLYRVELSNFWRLLYTIKNDEIYIYLIVLKVIDHKEYNKLFCYK
jgi:hypothetical protein